MLLISSWSSSSPVWPSHFLYLFWPSHPKMTLYTQQPSSPAKPVVPVAATSAHLQSSQTPQLSQPMSTIICTGPVIPSVVYHHHHMYYLQGGQQQLLQGNAQLHPQFVAYGGQQHNPLSIALQQGFVESVGVGGQQLQLRPQITIPLPFNQPQGPSFLLEHSSNTGNSFDRSKLKEQLYIASSKIPSGSSSFASSSSCSSAGSSLYFASRSTTTPSSPSSASPPATLQPTSSTPSEGNVEQQTSPLSEPSSSQSAKAKTVEGEGVATVAASTSTLPKTNSGVHAPRSSFTPLATAAAPLLSSVNYNCSPLLLSSAYLPNTGFGNAFFSPATQNNAQYHNQQQHQFQQQQLQAQTNVTSPPFSYRDYYARFGVHYTPVPWNQS